MTPLTDLLQRLRDEPLLVLRDFPRLDRDELLAYCRSASADGEDPLLHWEFGPVMELRVDDQAKNYLFSREAVPFHWDGVFFQVPHVLVFQCLEAPPPGAGGETLFAFAENLCAELSSEQRARWAGAAITYRTKKLAHYGGDVTIPVFGTHPQKGTSVVRFAEAVATDKNPVTTTVSGIAADEGAAMTRWFTERLYAPENCQVHEWRPGDLVLADNHALMHGRRAFAWNAPRHIRRVQIR